MDEMGFQRLESMNPIGTWQNVRLRREVQERERRCQRLLEGSPEVTPGGPELLGSKQTMDMLMRGN